MLCRYVWRPPKAIYIWREREIDNTFLFLLSEVVYVLQFKNQEIKIIPTFHVENLVYDKRKKLFWSLPTNR